MSFIEENDGEGKLVLPIDRRSFGDFIIGLLGQRRSIERTFDSYRFYIDLNWLIDLDRIIDQRANQNENSLVAFSARFTFEDGRVIAVTSRAALHAFRDISTRLATGVELRWTYLIKFPSKSIPERQEVTFRSFTDKKSKDSKQSKAKSKDFLKSEDNDEEMFFSVQFSDLTWGEDISNHLVSFIEAKSERMGRIMSFVRSLDIRSLLPLVFSFGMLGTLYFLPTGFGSNVLQKYQLNPGLSSAIQNPEARIEFLVDGMAAMLNRDANFVTPMLKLFAVFISLSAAFWAVRVRKVSFIAMNEHSERYYKKYNNRYEVIKYGVLLASVVGIVGGIFSNRIYDYLKTAGLFGLIS